MALECLGCEKTDNIHCSDCPRSNRKIIRPRSQPKFTIEEIAKAAAEANMSYGQFVAKMNDPRC